MPSYTHWSDAEIERLTDLYRMELDVDEIARVLDRSPRAVEHAIKNVLLQDLAHSSPTKVMSKYNLSYENLYYDFVPGKYYQKEKHSAFSIIVAVIVLYLAIVALGMFVTKE